MIYRQFWGMKHYYCILLILIAFNIDRLSAQSFGLQAGLGAIPSQYFALEYRALSNSNIYLVSKVFGEFGAKYALQYSAYGLDLMGEYSSNSLLNTDSRFSFRLGLGLTSQLEFDPWIYSGWSFSKRLQYGISGQTAIEWSMSDVFGMYGFAQQKLFFHRNLGTSHFLFGLGLVFHLPND